MMTCSYPYAAILLSYPPNPPPPHPPPPLQPPAACKGGAPAVRAVGAAQTGGGARWREGIRHCQKPSEDEEEVGRGSGGGGARTGAWWRYGSPCTVLLTLVLSSSHGQITHVSTRPCSMCIALLGVGATDCAVRRLTMLRDIYGRICMLRKVLGGTNGAKYLSTSMLVHKVASPQGC